MASVRQLKAKLENLIHRSWDAEGIAAGFERLSREGIPPFRLTPADVVARRQEILADIERRAEEYEYLSHSCAKGSALALMEAFGLGSMEIIVEDMEKKAAIKTLINGETQ